VKKVIKMIKLTTLIDVLHSNGIEAWEDVDGDIEVVNTYTDDDGFEKKEVVSIMPTVEAVRDFLGY
jgi:hypothetical protein